MVSCPGQVLCCVRLVDGTVKKLVEITLMSAVSHILKIGEDLAIVYCVASFKYSAKIHCQALNIYLQVILNHDTKV